MWHTILRHKKILVLMQKKIKSMKNVERARERERERSKSIDSCERTREKSQNEEKLFFFTSEKHGKVERERNVLFHYYFFV